MAMRLFYPDFAAMPRQDWPAATRFLTEFLAAGRPEPAAGTPRLWTGSRTRPSSPRASAGWRGRMCGRCPTCTGGAFLAGSTPSARAPSPRWWPSGTSCAWGKKLEPWELDFYRTHRRRRGPAPRPRPGGRREKQPAAGAAGRLTLPKGGT